MNICIVGAGTYGSYIAKCLCEKNSNVNITILEVGDKNIRNESQIGFYSKIFGDKYKGLSFGRYFGLGGTSSKWGGQILTFSRFDFEMPNKFLREIININEKYKYKIHNRFDIPLPNHESKIGDNLLIKSGIWLSVFKRNLFIYFKISKLKNIKIITHTRVIKLIKNFNQFNIIEYTYNDKIFSKQFDFIFLACGAFESSRILLASNLLQNNEVNFSDHLSKKYCTIIGSTKIANEDFVFKLNKFSLLTKRIIGEQDNVSFYLHPVYNHKFKFFEKIKLILFSNSFNFIYLFKFIFYTLIEFPIFLKFIFSIIFRKRILVLNNSWDLYLDIENPNFKNTIKLSLEKDKMGINGLDINYLISDVTSDIISKIEDRIDAYLNDNNVKYIKDFNNVDTKTLEDIYHPFCMFEFKDINDYYTRYNKLLIVNTGILPRSGGINPTGALFPIIEDFITNHIEL
jgi:hypothetical protein